MSQDGDISRSRDSSPNLDSEANKSFVRKVKSRVSGFIPSSLSKWFGSKEGPKVRHRDELDDDDDSFQLQPPAKRVKLPADGTTRDHLEMNFVSTPLHGSSNLLNNFKSVLHSDYGEPKPGPSGVTSRKLQLPHANHFNGPVEVHNGDKDSDSGESTSGYSSMPRIGSKEQVSEITDKHCTPQTKINNRSLFNPPAVNERSLFTSEFGSPQLNTSLSSRRPAFNTSTFGSSNFMDRTLSTKRIVNSPFYGGRTTYGGASAYSRNILKRSPEFHLAVKNYVHPKPANESVGRPLSKTARRILDTLEQYTSPSEDVKKIPNPPTKRVHKPEGLISKYTGVNPYLMREHKVPSNIELQVPTTSDLFKMKLKERLQDSTVSVREIATKSNSILNQEEYKLRTVDEPTSTKNTMKIKAKVSSIRHKATSDQSPTTVKLPEVKLPITTLPNFNITIPYPKKEAIKPPTKTTENKVEPKKTKAFATSEKPIENKDLQKSVQYEFSKPVVISENLKSIKAINNFKFSEPVCKKNEKVVPFDGVNFKTIESSFVPIKKAAKNNGDSGAIQPAKDMLQYGSVMDILCKKDNLIEKFKPAEGSWECNMCMIRNLPDKKKCVACETPKVEVQPFKTKTTNDFGDKFKAGLGQWECTSCMVRNDPNKTKCVACETLKEPSNTSKPPSFGDKFKKPANKWECTECFVTNDNTQQKCIACTTPKPTPKGSSVTVPIINNFPNSVKSSGMNSWECPTCMIKNEQNKSKCVACETTKPQTNSSIGGLFKKKENEWECDSCMVRNSSDRTKCQCCESLKPGSLPSVTSITIQNKTETIPMFNFGIDKAKLTSNGFEILPKAKAKVEETGTNSIAPSTIFGESAKLQTASTPAFSFGIKPVNGAKTANAEKIVEDKPVVKILENKLVTPAKEFSFAVTPVTSAPKSLKRTSTDISEQGNLKKQEFGLKTPTNSTLPAVNGIIKNGEVSKPATTMELPKFDFSNKTIKEYAAPTCSLLFGAKPATSGTTINETTSIFGDKPAKTNNGNVFGTSVPAPISKPSSLEAATSNPIFGAPASKEKQSELFSFKATPKVEPSSAAPPLFTFGASKSAEPPAYNVANNAPSGGFTGLGSTIPNGGFNNPITTPNKATFNFSAPSAASFNFSANKANSSKPAFGTSNAVPPPAFGTQTQNAPIFGSPAASTFGTPSSTFGTPQSNPATFGSQAASTPSFGTPVANPPAFGAPTASTFGTPTPNAPQTFGTPATNSPFVASNTPTLGFGAPASNPSHFGETATASNAFASAAPAFGAQASEVPAFGTPSTQNGIFNFGGSANTTPKTGFNFGGNSAAPSGGFNFGSNVNKPASSDFKFGGSAPTFNADVKPKFNFTSGAAPSAFTAQPQSGECKPQTQRVIRRALRRTQR